MQVTVQDIFRGGFSAFQGERDLPARISRAANAIVACRTGMLGGHVERCPDGHFAKIHYNSCRHRACPGCRFIRVEHWLEVQRARFLDCGHHHVVFTIPDELNSLWQYNRQQMTDLLFAAASETLVNLLGDTKYLGAKPGIVATLHTWGQTLQLHPHLHCVVTAGGLDKDGDWREPKKRVFIPGRVARDLFQGRFLGKLSRLLRACSLRLPTGLDDEGAQLLVDSLWRKHWNVHVMERYEHVEGVLNYLGRYVRGGPIGNERIVSFDGERVTFRYADNRDKEPDTDKGKSKVMTLDVDEFLRRFLEHVPPIGMRVVRSYGLYANAAKRSSLARARRALGQKPAEKPRTASIDRVVAVLACPDPRCCPACGKRLVRVGELPRDDRGRRRLVARWAA